MADTMRHPSDDDLLSAAIPIDPNELEDEPDVVEIEDADDDLEPIEVDASAEPASSAAGTPSPKIRQFTEHRSHEDVWNRTPNATGQGAIHVKTFVAKLRLDAIDHLDEQVNEWLDNHPEYEVKFVSTTVGRLVGKTTEDALFMSVWV
jgi:hypothetical protein